MPVIGPPAKEKPAHQRPMSEEWYESNAPLVREYLGNLPDSKRGTALAGIPLSSGSRGFEGDVFRGRSSDISPGLTVVLLEREGKVSAYFWLEEGGEPVPLDACAEGDDEGVRAYRLGGGPYAWRSLRPEHGILYTTCPPASWLARGTTP